MKKNKIVIGLFLVCLLFTLASCDLLNSIVPSETETPKEEEVKTPEPEQPAEQEEESSEYRTLANNLKKKVSEAETLDDYLDAVLDAVKNIPRDDILTATQVVAGKEAVDKIDQYYDQVYVVLSCVQALDITDILQHIDENGDIINKIGGLIGSLIGKDITVTKNEDGSYSALGLTLVVGYDENADESYRVTTKDGDLYEIAYYTVNRFLTVTVTKEEKVASKIESRLVKDDIYLQFLNADEKTIFQTHVDTEKLQANVSIQNDADGFSSTLSDSVPADFATKGQTYILNKDLLK